MVCLGMETIDTQVVEALTHLENINIAQDESGSVSPQHTSSPEELYSTYQKYIDQSTHPHTININQSTNISPVEENADFIETLLLKLKSIEFKEVQINDLKELLAKRNERVQLLEKQLPQLQNLKHELSARETTIKDLTDMITTLKTELNTSNATNTILENKVTNLLEQISQINDINTGLSHQNIQLQQRNNSLKKANENLQFAVTNGF
jgi:chromosome segregation ATPase